ncbi:MAG: hypothetical protein ABI845_12895 [Polaromonas sp.]
MSALASLRRGAASAAGDGGLLLLPDREGGSNALPFLGRDRASVSLEASKMSLLHCNIFSALTAIN